MRNRKFTDVLMPQQKIRVYLLSRKFTNKVYVYSIIKTHALRDKHDIKREMTKLQGSNKHKISG